MAQLTERQKEIKRLQDNGLSPAEIGAALEITTNAVYQQLRRMHQRNGSKSTRRSNASTGRRPSPAPAPAPAPAVAATVTPLQAIRHRKSEIEGEIRESQRRHDLAAKAAKITATDHEKLVARRSTELEQLTSAESALSRRGSRRAAAKPRRKARKGSAVRKRSTAKAKAAQNGQSNGQGSAAAVPPPPADQTTAKATA